jgi:hypothetical protein
MEHEPCRCDDRRRPARQVLILYQHEWTHVKTIAHYLESFSRYSRFHVSYVSSLAKCHLELDYFDAVVLHYSVRVCHPGYLSRSFARALRRYSGLKALFLQDEYENTRATLDALEELGIHLVFTCVPEPSVRQVYPESRFPGVRFVSVLTGYVPLDVDGLCPSPLRQRPVLVGYRGRNLGYWYGDLGREKVLIGMGMKEACERRGLPADIAWQEEDRIYGNDWFAFLGRCKATLGTESGSNVFDPDGALRRQISKEVLIRPDVSYQEIRARYLEGMEGKVVMNQVSPKVFEAIACRTALVLFEGHYSGVVAPGRHYIALKKDFSNVDEVLGQLQDDDYLEELTGRAYREVIQSGQYSYRRFVERCDDLLEECWRTPAKAAPPWLPLPPGDAVLSFRKRYQRNFQPGVLRRMWRCLPKGFRAGVHGVVGRQRLENVWLRYPEGVKAALRPLLRLARLVLRRSH